MVDKVNSINPNGMTSARGALKFLIIPSLLLEYLFIVIIVFIPNTLVSCVWCDMRIRERNYMEHLSNCEERKKMRRKLASLSSTVLPHYQSSKTSDNEPPTNQAKLQKSDPFKLPPLGDFKSQLKKQNSQKAPSLFSRVCDQAPLVYVLLGSLSIADVTKA